MSSISRMRDGIAFAVILWTGMVLTSSSSAWATNPVPQISQPLVPGNISVGALGFTMTVNGSGFVQGSLVYWNSTARKTTFVSSTQLTANIPPKLFPVPGTVSVTVVNPAPGGGTSNVVFFQVTSCFSR